MGVLKTEMPNFIHINVIVSISDKENERARIKARLNPLSINSYAEGIIRNFEGIENYPVVQFFVSGHLFQADMTIDEADKMFEEIERGMSFNESE